MYYIDLKEFRRANKMTQKSLAAYLGVGQGFISQIEKGDRPLPDKYISKILADETMDSSMVSGSASCGYRNAEEDFHRSVMGALSAVEKIAESNRLLAESNKQLTETNQMLATSNTKLTDQLAVFMEELQKKIRYTPPVEPKIQVASDVEGHYDPNPENPDNPDNPGNPVNPDNPENPEQE